MENRNELHIRDLTPAQLYALESAARRHRSVEMGRLIALAVANVKNFFVRALPQGSRTHEVRHA